MKNRFLEKYFSVEFFYVLFLLSDLIKIYLNYLVLIEINFTLLISIIIFVIFLLKLINKKFIIYLDGDIKISIILLVIFYFYVILSLILSSSQYYSSIKFISFSSAVFAFVFPLIFNKFQLDRFFYFFFRISLIITFLYLINFLFTKEKLIEGQYLIIGFLSGLNFLLYFFIYKNQTINLIYYFFILLLSAARGPFISLFFILFFYYIKKPIKLLTNIRLIFYLSIFLLSIFFYHETLLLIFQKTIGRFSQLSPDLLFESSSVVARIEHYYFLLKNILEKPIFGWGFGTYGLHFTGIDQRSSPHNIFLEIYFELGVLGLYLYLLFIIFCYYKTFKSKKYLLYILFYLLLCLQFSFSLADLRLNYGFIAITLLISRDKYFRNK